MMATQRWRSARFRLLRSGGGRCCYCNRMTFENPPEPGLKRTIEHVTPRSKGGSNAISNLRIACYRCNNARGNKTNHLPLSERIDR
jgi:5-methylcytosine-specific restriction endonuclease McrA